MKKETIKRNLIYLALVLLILGAHGAVFDVAYAAEYNEEAAEHIVELIDDYAEPYLGTDTLTNYDKGRAIQCHAFTNYIWKNVFGHDVYSSKAQRTEASNDYDTLGEYVNKYARVGDMLRVDGKHSMVITSFDEDTVSGYDWLQNKKERKCTYTWEGVKEWGDGTQNYWLYQIDDSVYDMFSDQDYKIGSKFGPEPGEITLPKEEDEPEEQQSNRGDSDRTQYGKIVVQVNNPVMTLDGAYQNIDASGTAPVIVNDRVVTPIRAIVESMGGTVSWNNEARTVGISYGQTEMILTIDSSVIKVNGNDVHMDVAPVIINDRTMLPIRYITEYMGGEVEWFDSIQAVAIKYKR